MNGILNIYKEAGFTSHDVVAKLRGITRQKKIGHTGTLDPDAEGVLPVCLGNATKLSSLLSDKEKTYSAVMLLGCTTDTQDLSGIVLDSHEVDSSEEGIRAAIFSFLGDYDQIPPMYSAKKVGGKKLYELAREGREVERVPSRVHIYEIEIFDISVPEVSFSVTCSSGTYIRTLCHDIGQRLGCGACMKSLLRTRVDRFRVEDALRLRKVEELAGAGALESILLPVDALFYNCPRVKVKPCGDRLVRNGNPFRIENVDSYEAVSSDIEVKEEMLNEGHRRRRVRVYTSDGVFTGLYTEYIDDGLRIFKPEKMFLP